MWPISSPYSSPYPGKTDLQTTPSLPTSDVKIEGGRKGNTAPTAGKSGTWDGLGSCLWEIGGHHIKKLLS